MTIRDPYGEDFLVFPGRGRAFCLINDLHATEEPPENFLDSLFGPGSDWKITEITSQEKRNTIKALFGELIDYPDWPLESWEVDIMKRRGTLA